MYVRQLLLGSLERAAMHAMMRPCTIVWRQAMHLCGCRLCFALSAPGSLVAIASTPRQRLCPMQAIERYFHQQPVYLGSMTAAALPLTQASASTPSAGASTSAAAQGRIASAEQPSREPAADRDVHFPHGMAAVGHGSNCPHLVAYGWQTIANTMASFHEHHISLYVQVHGIHLLYGPWYAMPWHMP